MWPQFIAPGFCGPEGRYHSLQVVRAYSITTKTGICSDYLDLSFLGGSFASFASDSK